MKSIDSKISPEQNLSRQRIPLNGDDTIVRKIARRTSEKAVLNSSKFQHSQTTNITQRRADYFNYERKPVYRFANSVEEVQDPKFLTEIDIQNEPTTGGSSTANFKMRTCWKIM